MSSPFHILPRIPHFDTQVQNQTSPSKVFANCTARPVGHHMSKFPNSHGAPMLLCPVALRRPTTRWGGRSTSFHLQDIHDSTQITLQLLHAIIHVQPGDTGFSGDGVTRGHAAKVTWSNSTRQETVRRRSRLKIIKITLGDVDFCCCQILFRKLSD